MVSKIDVLNRSADLCGRDHMKRWKAKKLPHRYSQISFCDNLTIQKRNGRVIKKGRKTLSYLWNGLYQLYLQIKWELFQKKNLKTMKVWKTLSHKVTGIFPLSSLGFIEESAEEIRFSLWIWTPTHTIKLQNCQIYFDDV